MHTAGEANPSTHFAKDRPPPNPPSRFQRWIAGSQPSASEPGYGYPSTGIGATALEREPRPVDAGADAEALKQLAVFRSTAEARAISGRERGHEPPRPPPAASIPSTLETPLPSTASPPVSRSGALARAFTFSSRLSRDPFRPRVPPTDATLSTALASSGVLPPPSSYTPPVRSRAVFFRVLRRSRDGGVRLAGGAPGKPDADILEYDRRRMAEVGSTSVSEGSTLPPEYQRYPAGAGR